MKKKTLITIALVAALAMVAAVTVYAVANYGSREDPLVTSSYLMSCSRAWRTPTVPRSTARSAKWRNSLPIRSPLRAVHTCS